MAFVHLHTHSEYSLLDGANRIPDLLDRVQALGMDSLAITDHGNLHGAWQFYTEAKARNVRPILGFEAYLAFGSRLKRERPTDAPAVYSHLVLLARNRRGYHNLVKLSSIGFLEGYYRRPRIDREVLERHHEGLIGLAACLSGEIALYLRQGNYEAAKASAQYFARVFGPDGFWLEVQSHGIADERVVAAGMFRLAAELGLPVVATNDAHYLKKEDAEAHDVLLAIGTGKDLDDPNRFRFFGQESYVKSEPEMAALFADHPEVLAETARVAEGCEFDFEKRYFLPQYPRAPEFASDNDLLVHLARAGALRRPPAPRRSGAARLRAGRHLAHRLRRVFPHRLRHREGREGPRYPGGAGARLRRRVARGVRPRHHGHRAAHVRPAVRAVPEPRARLDAGHRSRLLLRTPGPGHPVRAGALRPRIGGPDHHLRDPQGARRVPRRGAHAADRARRGRPVHEAHPGGPRRHGHAGRCTGAVAGTAAAGPPRRARAQGARAGHPHRGARSTRLGARRGRRERAGPAHRLRARVPRPPGAGRHHHAVRHGGARAGRDAEDRHPRPQDADGDPRRAPHGRGAPRHHPRPGRARPRGRERLQAARLGAHRGRLPVRVTARHRLPAEHEVRPVRRPGRHQRAAPAGTARLGDAPGLHPSQAGRGNGAVSARRAAGGARTDVRGDRLPGTGDADRQRPRRLQPRRGRRAPEGSGEKGQGTAPAGVGSLRRARRGARTRPPHDRGHRRADRDLRALRVPQSALRRLQRPLVPDGVAQDVLSGRVHGRPAVVRNRQYRQGGAVHQRGARAGPRGAAA